MGVPFGSDSVDALNGWINEKTHEMIPHMIDEMPDEALLYLVNTVAFQASWLERYDSQYNVHEATFTDDSGKKSPIELMYSEEPFYLKDGDQADGFMKEYAGYRYARSAQDHHHPSGQTVRLHDRRYREQPACLYRRNGNHVIRSYRSRPVWGGFFVC